MNWESFQRTPLVFLLLLPCLTGCQKRSPDVVERRHVQDVNRETTSGDATRAPEDVRRTDVARIDIRQPDAIEVPACIGEYAAPVAKALLQTSDLKEVSGIAASRKNAGVLWMHNDSGDTARVFAVTEGGEVLAEVKLSGVSPIDFEDIALAKCPTSQGDCLWVADTGDNFRLRRKVVLYAFPEPTIPPGGAEEALLVSDVSTYPFKYPGGAVDSEALVVSADGSSFWMFEKVDGDTARIFGGSTAEQPVETQTLVLIGEFPSPGIAVEYGRMITGADLHPGQKRVVLRVYTGTYEYRFEEALAFGSMGGTEPVQVALGPLTELQGEAVAYGNDGLGIWTCSEDPSMTGEQPLHYYACVDGVEESEE